MHVISVHVQHLTRYIAFIFLRIRMLVFSWMVIYTHAFVFALSNTKTEGGINGFLGGNPTVHFSFNQLFFIKNGKILLKLFGGYFFSLKVN